MQTNSELVRHGILESLKHTSQESEPFAQKDPVRQAFTRFQDQFKKTLQGICLFDKAELNVCATDTDHFYQRHVVAAFLCRWNKCPHSTHGFSCVEERDRHEQILQRACLRVNAVSILLGRHA